MSGAVRKTQGQQVLAVLVTGLKIRLKSRFWWTLIGFQKTFYISFEAQVYLWVFQLFKKLTVECRLYCDKEMHDRTKTWRIFLVHFS